MKSNHERMYSPEELAPMIPKMEKVRTAFYSAAIQIGNHAFIEFCGLMGEYVKICQQTLDKGEDFTVANNHSGQSLVVHDFNINYLAEKFECIFGPVFEDPKFRDAFMRRMGWVERPKGQ